MQIKFFGSGDHDMCVPYTGSEAWTRSMGYKIVDEWRPWTANGQVAGYESVYEIFLLINMVNVWNILSFCFCFLSDLLMILLGIKQPQEKGKIKEREKTNRRKSLY